MNLDLDAFNREIMMCRDLNSRNNGRCNWGQCDKCGVIPLLYKLYKDEFIDEPDRIYKIKKDIFNPRY